MFEKKGIDYEKEKEIYDNLLNKIKKDNENNFSNCKFKDTKILTLTEKEKQDVRLIQLNKENNQEFYSTKVIDVNIQSKILHLLFLHIELHRKQICSFLNKKWTTIYDNLEKLEKKNYVYRCIDNKNKVGRPEIIWSISEIGYNNEIEILKGGNKKL